MIISTPINRFARAVDFPGQVPNGSIALVNDVSAPSTSFENLGYDGMNGLGLTLRERAGLGDLSNIGDYFTSANYYLGYVGIAAAAFLLLGKSGKAKARQTARRASLKGAIAREQELLKSA